MQTVLGSFAEKAMFRLHWRAALERCGLPRNSAQVVSLVRRTDGKAITVTVRSLLPQAADLCSQKGIDRLAWALARRVVALATDPYQPTLHRFLIEIGPLVVDDLPVPDVMRSKGTASSILLGLHLTTGEEFSLDLWSAKRGSVHVLVAGATGSGKSNTVNALLTGLIANRFCVVGIDCKAGETLRPWEKHLGHPVIDPSIDPDGAEALLARLVKLMENRQRCPGPNYQPIVLAVEEWSSLPMKPTTIGDHLERLAAQGRSASIGLVLTTQRPTSNVGAVRTSTRGNLSIRIAHSTIGDRAASEAILGAGTFDAADLPTSPPGNAFVRQGGADLSLVRIHRCQGPPWPAEAIYVAKLAELEGWDAAAQREIKRLKK